MTPGETDTLLRFISTALDRPVPPDETVEVWAVLMADAPYRWARDAALDLTKTSPFWPKPADVLNRAKEMYLAEKARQARERQLAVEGSKPPEAPQAAAAGPALVRGLLAAIAERNKGEVDRDKRRLNATMVAAEFRATHGVAPDRPGLPCTNKMCRCNHTEGCDAGWIEVGTDDGTSQAYPCQQCNSRRHTVLMSGSTRDAAQRALRDTSDVKAEAGEAW